MLTSFTSNFSLSPYKALRSFNIYAPPAVLRLRRTLIRYLGILPSPEPPIARSISVARSQTSNSDRHAPCLHTTSKYSNHKTLISSIVDLISLTCSSFLLPWLPHFASLPPQTSFSDDPRLPLKAVFHVTIGDHPPSFLVFLFSFVFVRTIDYIEV